jgi:ABC-type Fe3+ transport system substrate-binding protein
MKGILGSFKERYPFIEVDFFGASRHERLVKTLAAYKSGKFLGDIVFSTASHLTEFQAVGLEDLRTLPAMQNVPSAFKDANGTWVGTDLIYWCISYNTKLVKKEELPKTWEDLLTNPKWRGGNLALGNYPNLWAANLWATKGEAWTKEFLTRLFGELKPQLRKEGVTALVQLTAAGEFYGALPTTQKTAYEVSLQGAPIGFTCPAPVPASAGDAVILKGAPNVHAARVFLNWYLSKEGQIAKYAFDYALPLHEGLRIKLLPFPDQILGKEPAYRAENFEQTIMPKLGELWNNLWLGGGRSGR